jgi:hypothetical protein
MVELELKKQLYNVIVIGPDGAPLGELSAKGIIIHDENSASEAEKTE